MGLLQSSASRRRETLEIELGKRIKSGKITEKEAETWRIMLSRQIQSEVDARRDEIRKRGPSTSMFGSPMGQQWANRSTFGLVPRLVGMVSPQAQQRMETELSAQKQEYPNQAMAGEVGAFFTPGSPLRGVTNIAARGAAMPLSRVASSQRVAGAFSESPITNFMLRAATQISSNVMGAGGAITASNLTDFNESKSIRDRMKQSVEQTMHPTNLLLSISTGGVQSALRRPFQQANERLLRDAERILGPRFKPSPDLARPEPDPLELGLVFRQLANLPVGRQIARKWLQKSIFDPMDDALNRMARSLGGEVGVGEGALAARGAQKISSRLERNRQHIESRAFAEEGEIWLTSDETRSLGKQVLGALSEMNALKEGQLNPKFKDAYRRFAKTLLKNPEMPRRLSGARVLRMQDVEDFRQLVSRAAKYGSSIRGGKSPIDEKVSGRIYSLITETFRQKAPKIKQAHEASEFIRGLEASLPKNMPKVPESALRELFSGKDMLINWQSAKRYMTPIEIQQTRGWYLSRFLEKVMPSDGETKLLNNRAMKGLFRGGDAMFRRDIFDDVLPGLRQPMETLANTSHRVQRGLGVHEGSPTAGRVAVLGGIGMVMASPIVVREIIAGDIDTSTAALQLLGAAGTGILINSLVRGNAAAQLNNLARGVPVQGPQASAAALQEQIQGGQQ